MTSRYHSTSQSNESHLFGNIDQTFTIVQQKTENSISSSKLKVSWIFTTDFSLSSNPKPEDKRTIRLK